MANTAITNKMISEYLDKQNIDHGFDGYRYLMLLIRAIIDGKVDRYHMKPGYEYVAEQEKTRPIYVESGIRRVLYRLNTPDQPVITNRDFIIKAVDTMLLEADENCFPF